MCIISCSEFIKGYYAGQKTTATTLAQKFGLNIRTLNPSLNKLTHAGILRSQVGSVDRGYIFSRDPKEISIYEIVNATEGFDYMKNCKQMLAGVSCAHKECDDCILYKASSSIVDFSREEYKKISVYDLFMGKEQNKIAALTAEAVEAE